MEANSDFERTDSIQSAEFRPGTQEDPLAQEVGSAMEHPRQKGL